MTSGNNHKIRYLHIKKPPPRNRQCETALPSRAGPSIRSILRCVRTFTLASSIRLGLVAVALRRTRALAGASSASTCGRDMSSHSALTSASSLGPHTIASIVTSRRAPSVPPVHTTVAGGRSRRIAIVATSQFSCLTAPSERRAVHQSTGHTWHKNGTADLKAREKRAKYKKYENCKICHYLHISRKGTSPANAAKIKEKR